MDSSPPHAKVITYKVNILASINGSNVITVLVDRVLIPTEGTNDLQVIVFFPYVEITVLLRRKNKPKMTHKKEWFK